ncbi:MAG: hypothetical protein AAF334_02715 [Pseudomonadota bacterium]
MPRLILVATVLSMLAACAPASGPTPGTASAAQTAADETSFAALGRVLTGNARPGDIQSYEPPQREGKGKN